MFTKIPTIHQDGAGYTIHPNILLMHVQGLLFTKLWNVINVASFECDDFCGFVLVQTVWGEEIMQQK